MFPRIFVQFSFETDRRACDFLSERPPPKVMAFCQSSPLSLPLKLSMCCLGLGAGRVGCNRINRKFLRLWLVKDRMKNKSRDFQLLIQSRSLWNRWPQLSQDKTPDYQFLNQDKSSQLVHVSLAFEFPNQHTPSGTFLFSPLTGEVHVGGQEHFYMETQTVLVIPKTEDKELDIYVSSQDPAHVQVRSSISSTSSPTSQFPHRLQPPQPHNGPHFTCRILESKYYTSAEQLRPRNQFLCFPVSSSKWKNSHSHFRFKVNIHWLHA